MKNLQKRPGICGQLSLKMTVNTNLKILSNLRTERFYQSYCAKNLQTIELHWFCVLCILQKMSDFIINTISLLNAKNNFLKSSDVPL